MIYNVTYQKSNESDINRTDCNEYIIIIQAWNIGVIYIISKAWLV